MANFKRNNRYTNGTVQLNRSNQKFLELRGTLDLEQGPTDIFITITEEYINRPDLISNNVYGTIDLWWVIYEFNNISDPISDLAIGNILRLPPLSTVIAAINKLGT